jgi:Kef-type K+ transport system membrane component KefB
VETDLISLVVIVAISAFVPLIVGLLRLKIAEVVLLLAFGVVFGPELLGWIQIDDAISLLSELGLGVLFFLAGLELERKSVSGMSGRLAGSGWLISLAIALTAAFLLAGTGNVLDPIGVAIALTSTALGTLLPIVRDRGELNSRFGTFFMGAGAWGELGPIIAMSILLTTKSSLAAIISLLLFLAIALLLAILPNRFTNARVLAVINRGHNSSSQTGLRFVILLMVMLLALAGTFGLDAVLGAFLAGIIARRFMPQSEESRLQIKVEAIGFGFLIPLFFVVSGAKLDVVSIVQNPLPMVIAFFLILLVRGVPQWFLYRKALPNIRERTRFSLYVATGLPIIVAVTSLEVSAGLMTPANGAALVGAGALTVLIFPLLGNALDRKRKEPEAHDRAENTA